MKVVENGGHQVVDFFRMKAGFGRKCKLQVVDQQVVSPKKFYRIFLLGMFAFCSGKS